MTGLEFEGHYCHLPEVREDPAEDPFSAPECTLGKLSLCRRERKTHDQLELILFWRNVKPGGGSLCRFGMFYEEVHNR